jgi:replicative DNA helicase
VSYNLGLKVIKRLAEDQQPLQWYKAKLSVALFKGEQEKTVYEWVNAHVTKHHALPAAATLEAMFPEFKEFSTPEPVSYYTDLLEQRFGYDLINEANVQSQQILKDNKGNIEGALKVMKSATERIAMQRMRTSILDLGKEGPKLVLQTYHNVLQQEASIYFGWPYLDDMTGGCVGGDIISYVGRPASGKTFKLLRQAIMNWLKGQNILFASMEMNALAMAQRATAMYAKTNLTQLKLGGYSSQTYSQFALKMVGMAQEPAHLYVLDGNLAADVDDIYLLASQLKCKAIFIDGAYLLSHPNPRLDRYTKVAENAERLKRNTTSIELPTICSWQFSREASKSKLKAEEKVGLEHIAYSDAIGQLSSVVIGLFQEDGVETMYSRVLDVLKGRNGEVGQFKIHWDFLKMNFDQLELAQSDSELNYL